MPAYPEMPMLEFVTLVRDWIWSAPLMALLLGTGVWFSIILGWVQFRHLPKALRLLTVPESGHHHGEISNFQSLMGALSSTVGVGNIAGVATAVAAGGPGAIFWIWCTGVVGAATKYAEALLAVHYRVRTDKGTFCGGPMYYIESGLGQKWLAVLFAAFTVLASFGIGNTVQGNAINAALTGVWPGLSPKVVAAALTILVGIVVFGGLRRLAKVVSVLVPVMIGLYVVAVGIILLCKASVLPSAFAEILRCAFTPTAATGGFAGSMVKATVSVGLSRGLFSNEAGMGSSPIIAAAAKTKDPAAQALVSMLQTIIDTLVVCTLTGLALTVTGTWTSGATGPALTMQAFELVLGPAGGWIVSLSLILFAYSTLIGWAYYGERALTYLAGERAVPVYRAIFVATVSAGVLMRLEVVWQLSDVLNGLMAAPNLLALLCLTPVVLGQTRTFLRSKHPKTRNN